MKLSDRKRKWSKRILIFVSFWVFLGFAITLLIDYRLKEIIQLAVKDKSNDQYVFEAGNASFSFLKKNIIIRNATIFKKDTINTASHYQIKVARLYFGITSFKELIFHQKLIVDSLSLNDPLMSLHEHSKDTTRQKKHFHAENIESLIKKTLVHLQVKSFHIKNATYVFKSKVNPTELRINQINFNVKNFSDAENDGQHLFSTEDIDLSIGKQKINLPDGLHIIDFKKLHFSGRNQFFELDSFGFLAKATPLRTETKITADKFRFKSSALASIFSKDDLSIDTVLLLKPVLQFGKSKDKSPKSANNAQIKHLFKHIKLKYIGIEDGSFLNVDSLGAQEKYATKKVNVKIYNLSYTPSKQNSLQTDSIKLNLNKIKFLSNDGKSQLTVDELAIAKNIVVLRNAEYAPVHAGGNNSLSFKTPSLLLKKVDLTALLNKRISADEAELLNPAITVLSTPKLKTVKVVDTVADFSRVFSLFKSIKGLIAVKQFKIKDGSFHLKSHAKFDTDVWITKLNSRILVDKLLGSDTTTEIKHAIPEISFKQLKLNSTKLKLTLNDYFFNGLLRHNNASSVNVNLVNGTSIRAKKLFWEWLDWDLYNSYKLIYVDSLKVGELDITLKNSGQRVAAHKMPPKIQIGRLDVEHFTLNNINQKGNIRLSGIHIFAQQLKSVDKNFVWNNIGGDFDAVNYETDKLAIVVRSIKLNAKGVNLFEGINVKQLHDQEINLALLEVKGPFLSSNVKKLKLDFVHIIDPKIILKPQESGLTKEKKPFNFPIDFEIKNLIVKNGKIDVQKIKGNDTTKIIADLNLNLKNASGHKLGKRLLAFEDAKVQVDQLSFVKPEINLSAPFNLELNNTVLNKVNDKLELSTAIEFGSNKMNIHYLKDSTHYTVNDASIQFKDNKFKFEQGMPLAWEKFLYKTDLNINGINYQNKSSTVKVDNIKWLPENKRATLTGFDFKPNLSWEETRLKHPLQADYIAASAKNIELDDVWVSRMDKKEKLDIQRVLIDGLELSASRDKRMPDGVLKEKLMPSKLIANIKFPFKVTELALKNSNVNIHEISKATGKEGIIPLENVNVKVLNLTNQLKDLDSLSVVGSVDLLGKSKVSLNYRESYLDSLSGFKMNLAIVPMDLTNFSQISIPMAAVRVNSGNTETLFAKWSGNKYLADGEILFPYSDLNISLLDKKNPERKTFILFLENKLVNLILPNKNSKPAFLFFERNRNKFVFNYWIKTIMGGFVTSIGLKKERKLKKQEREAKLKYHLPQQL